MDMPVISKEPDYVLNHCTKYLARDNTDIRHSYFGLFDTERRSRISEPWRSPVIDAHDGPPDDRFDFNDVALVYALRAEEATAESIGRLAAWRGLHRPERMRQVGESLVWAVTLRVAKGQ